MALSRIASNSDLLTSLSRITHSVNVLQAEIQCTRYTAVHNSRMKGLHVTSIRRYPDPPPLPLPTNVSEIFANETGRFTPERTRDIAAPVLLYGKNNVSNFFTDQRNCAVDRSAIPPIREDTHVDSYDCFGAVSLNGTMQSNVPKPFCSSGKSMHLNMPGGQWSRDGKYIAEDMQKSHYRSIRFPQFKLNKNDPANKSIITSSLFETMYQARYTLCMDYSTHPSNKSKGTENKTTQDDLPLSKKEQINRLLKEYGLTAIFFHIGISLISLGGFYLAVIRGIDLEPIVKNIVGGESEKLEKIMNHSTNFLLAYTIHKLFAPVRISLSLTVTPILVRYLRRIGVIMRPQKKSKRL